VARAARSTDSSKNSVVKQVTDRFDASWKYAANKHHARWERNYKLYNNQRSTISYEGISNTFVPMTFSTIETLTAALAAGRPSIDFVPQDMYNYIVSYYNTGKKPDLKALNALFDYYWDCDNWDLKSIKTIRSGFIYGTSCEWIHWDQDKPRVINLAVRDAIIDPNLTDPMQLITNPKDFYGGRRYLTTLDALKAEKIVDPATGQLGNRFKNLSQVRPGSTGNDQTDKQLKEQMYVGATGATDELVEVQEVWDGEHIRSVANRTWEIEDRDNNLGVIPLVIHRFIADESVIHGKAIVDAIAAEQELLNDMSNQSIDSVTDILNPQYELDPSYSDYLPMIETGAPGVVYPFAPGSLKRIEKGAVTPNAFNERANLKNEIRETTGADQVVKGVESEGGKSTATEINAQLNQAGQRFELYVRMLEKEAFYQRAKIVFKMMLTYVSDRQLVPTNSTDGPKFFAFDPEQFDETYEPKIQLEASIRIAKSRDQNVATEAYTAIIADPTNNLWQAKKILYPKMFDLTEEQLDNIIGNQPPPPPAASLGPEGMPEEDLALGAPPPVEPAPAGLEALYE
jgi:hypothetical protein